MKECKKAYTLTIFLFILLLATLVTAVDTKHYIVVGDQSPASDVVLATKLRDEIKRETEIDLDGKIASEVTRKDLDGRVTVVIDNNRAKVIIGDNDPAENVIFANKIIVELRNLGIETSVDTAMLTSEVESDNLLDVFDSNSNEKSQPIDNVQTNNKCIDSDNGLNLDVAGKANNEESGTTDFCDQQQGTNIIVEATCATGKPTHVKMACPSDKPYCNRGKCSAVEPKCYDSDGGNKPDEVGTITETRYEEGPEHTDYCQHVTEFYPWENCEGEECGVREYYCADNGYAMVYDNIKCPYGCSSGRCLTKGEQVKTTQKETHQQKEEDVTRRQNEKSVKEEVKLIEKQTTVCEEGEKKAYTCTDKSQVAWCECIGNTWECAGNPESQCPEKEEKEQNQCSGCLYEEKCIPYGTRVEQSYCDVAAGFIEQKTSKQSCSNNYECSSNVCVNNSCVDPGILQRIIDWFTRVLN